MDKTTINPINKTYNKCLQYALTVALSHEEKGKNRERITKIKSFITKYNWEEIHFLSEKDDWKNIEKDSVTIALNVFYTKKEKIYLLMFQNITQIVKKVILLMIPIEKDARLSPKDDDDVILQYKNYRYY